jgi:hypothetical protein
MRPWLCLAFSVALAACSSDDNGRKDTGGKIDSSVTVPDSAPKPDLPKIDVSFKELKGYEVFKGQMTVKVNVSANVNRVELLGDTQFYLCGTGVKMCAKTVLVASSTSAPFDLTWDTSAVPDNIIMVAVKAYVGNGNDSVTTAKVPVIVMNNGEEVTWTDGHTGKVTVAATGYVDQHLKYHWTMPADVKEVVGLLSWDSNDFTLELKVGVGECPDTGTTAAGAQSATSPCLVEYIPTKGTVPSGSMWFGHVQLMNPTEAKIQGKETSFEIKAYLLK